LQRDVAQRLSLARCLHNGGAELNAMNVQMEVLS
jgi:hypothetical protein